MKKEFLALCSIVLSTGMLFGQVKDLGGPIGWKRTISTSQKAPLHTMSGFDLQAIQAEDQINDADKSIPWRFGYKYDAGYTLADGIWYDLPGENRLWRTEISCPGAMTINLLFENFYLPDGAFLYLYDKKQTNRVGAYTSANNRADGLLGSELVHGDHIVVEYYEPKAVSGQGHFTISHAIHGYRSLDRIQNSLEKALNSSGDCQVDVNCPLGLGWENQSRSVAMIVVNGGGVCTGALMNNTCEDGRPLILTANHCLSGATGIWAFRFNWKSPQGTESCATTDPSTDPGAPYDQSANGATMLVNGTEADHAMLEIDNMTLQDAQDWGVYYAGWNHDDTPGSITQATGIHHPSGDVMKICREDHSPSQAVDFGAEVWWIDQWEHGVTEGGSSGSPLFDQFGRVIGQLYGGQAACSGTGKNGLHDTYGRIRRIMATWGYGDLLAPTACGTVTVLDGWDPNGPADPDNAGIQAILSPNGVVCGDTFCTLL